ncbi:MAG: 9-hexadecenoic acid cis-trans isomerase [Gammaproteobacteria bacterium]|nr:MAG: 9-hexadecenoic acid cis-trans isomerase [Gammaproteobacteria bacterium]
MKLPSWISRSGITVTVLLLIGCASIGGAQWDKLYGTAKPIEYKSTIPAPGLVSYVHDIRPIIEQRCTVCHGCYDSPCQLKLDSFQGLLRGANSTKVYDGSRLLGAPLTRIFEDAHSTSEWRTKDFYPVLNERINTPEANIKGSIFAQMLLLKQENPSPSENILPESFDFSLNPRQYCSRIENFEDYRKTAPLWGMPYALPGLNTREHNLLMSWLKEGAQIDENTEVDPTVSLEIDKWEKLLNGDSNKEQLISRYIYEHLFLAQLFFADDLSNKFAKAQANSRQYFRLVRSRTPPGVPLDRISTGRPFDDPKVARVYYRLWRDPSSVVLKTHMPYALNKARMEEWLNLFFKPNYAVNNLPSYSLETASNPFITFAELPIDSRYRFMLNEARFTIMNFIKGPVCRGQVALNVIQDHFWVFFFAPKTQTAKGAEQFLADNSKHLELPAEVGNSFLPLTNWLRYSEKQKEYLVAKAKFVNELTEKAGDQGLSLIWDGNLRTNNNAALTIFRHNDSASVYQGLIGEPPKTAWVIDYPLLERIHYLLVAGFDVYGNVTHQLLSRVYMDFLRIEGEMNFLSLLPKAAAQKELAYWYRDAESNLQTYIDLYLNQIEIVKDFHYTSDNPKLELFDQIKKYLAKASESSHHIGSGSLTPEELAIYRQLQRAPGSAIQYLPQTMIIRVPEVGLFTLVHNSSYSNLSSLFGDEKRRIPDEDYLTITRGIVGSYPNSFMRVNKRDLPDFVARVHGIRSEADYQVLRDIYGIRRSNPDFWGFSDEMLSEYRKTEPDEAALLDYNRLENR